MRKNEKVYDRAENILNSLYDGLSGTIFPFQLFIYIKDGLSDANNNGFSERRTHADV